MGELEDPQSIVPHAPDYSDSAWKEYSVSELGWWVHLLVRRAGMRSNPEKKSKDLMDAQAYLDMIQAHVNAAK